MKEVEVILRPQAHWSNWLRIGSAIASESSYMAIGTDGSNKGMIASPYLMDKPTEESFDL